MADDRTANKKRTDDTGDADIATDTMNRDQSSDGSDRSDEMDQ